MLKTKNITLANGTEITLTEITVAQILTLLANADDAEALKINGFNLLTLATGLNPKDMLELTETDVVALWEACQELHPFFAAAIKIASSLPQIAQSLAMANFVMSLSKPSLPSPPVASAPSQASSGGVVGAFIARLTGTTQKS